MRKLVALYSLIAVSGCATKSPLSQVANPSGYSARPIASQPVDDFSDVAATTAELEASTIQLASAAVALANAGDPNVPKVDSASGSVVPESSVSVEQLVPTEKASEASLQAQKPSPVIRPEPIDKPRIDENDQDDLPTPAEPQGTVNDPSKINLDAVIDSVYLSYPMLEYAVQQRTIAAGEQLQALGNFDLKVTAASENQATGFYETYRQRVGIVQPRYEGGNFFGGYRVGRGNFEPWYKERETNEGGELRAGVAIPLAQDRRIDARRAELWRANAGRRLADPDINAQLIAFVQEASYAYWDWVAAGEKYRIAEGILRLAEERTEGIRRQTEEGLMDPPVLTDNLRLIADRRAALAAAQQKLRLTAVKLSLYYRGPDGRPVVPDDSLLPSFPTPQPISPEAMSNDISLAVNQRPELVVLAFVRQQLEIDFAQASNEFQPSLDAVVAGSQDVGTPASRLNDKGQFEAETSLYFDLPVQRRKARGKMQATRGKIVQVAAKQRLTEDKVVADVQAVYAALIAAYEQVQQMQQSVEYAEDLARRERRNLELGLGDLLNVALREQFAVEAAGKLVDSLLLYYVAQADYRAALAEDQLPQ